MWRFLICLMVLFVVGCQPLPDSSTPSTPTQIPVTITIPAENISMTIPPLPAGVPITVNVNIQLPPSAPISSDNGSIPAQPTTQPPEVTPMNTPEVAPPNFSDPSNIRLTFPPLTEADLQKAKDLLVASTDNITGGSAADWSLGVDNGRDGTVIFTKMHVADQVVYKIWIKDWGKPTQQILGYGKLDANGDLEPSSTQ